MATNMQELGREFQDLAARSLREQLNAAQRYGGLVQKLGSGELLRQPVGDAYVRFVGEEATRYAGGVASLVLDYYKGLFELGRAYNEKFFEQVIDRTTPGGASSPAQASSARSPSSASPSRQSVDIELGGTVGQDAARSFILESRRAEATDISFLVSDFVGPAGTASFRAELEFQPERFTLRPGEERVVIIRLPLRGELFTPGLRYTATALVRGYDDLELNIGVTPAAPESQPAAPANTSS